MMAERKTLARPYAKAVFEIAGQANAYDQWSQWLSIFAMIAEDPIMWHLLQDRTIDRGEVANFFLSICEQGLNETAKNFILALADYRRLKLLPEIKALFTQFRSDKENTIAVQFASVVVLTKEEENKFKKMLEHCFNRTVKMHCSIDNKLLGGFVARAGNYVVNGSMQQQLINLRETIGETQ